MAKKSYSIRLQFIILATVLGNLLQWFDFSLFGIMLPLFMKLFFPDRDRTIFFILFAFGALARPIGGLIFGYLGDTLGRKTALVRTILFMTIPIFLVALLPTTKEIGYIAGFFLLVLYLFQGICVGGEFTGSMIFLTESSPPRLRGFLGSWAYFGVTLGMFLVAIDVYELNQNLSLKALQDWGWRIPFFMGALVGIIGIFMRHFLHETPIFKEAKQYGHLVKKPLFDTIRKHKKNLFKGMGIYLLDSLGFNLVLVYSNFYFLDDHKLGLPQTFRINILTLFTSLLFFPLMGKLGNYIGNVKLAKWATVLIFVFAYPLYLCITQKENLHLLLFGQALVNILNVTYACNMPMVLYNLYPTEVRYTCTAVVINCTVAFFGGTAPILAHTFIHDYHFKMMPSIYLMIGAVIAFLLLRTLKDSAPQK